MSHVTLGRFLNLKSIRSFRALGLAGVTVSVRSAGSGYTGKVPDSHGRSLGAL